MKDGLQKQSTLVSSMVSPVLVSRKHSDALHGKPKNISMPSMKNIQECVPTMMSFSKMREKTDTLRRFLAGDDTSHE